MESVFIRCYNRVMTKLLEKALERVSALPDDEQDAVASIILEELDDEARWRATFARSQDALARLADAAHAEIGRGEVQPLNRGMG